MNNNSTVLPNEQKKDESRLAAKQPVDGAKNAPSIVESNPEFRYVKLRPGHWPRMAISPCPCFPVLVQNCRGIVHSVGRHERTTA